MVKQVMKLGEIQRFAAEIFDRVEVAQKAGTIPAGILEACSPRISNISHAVKGNPEANYKTIQRFSDHNDPRKALHRLYSEEARFILGDPTDIEEESFKDLKSLLRLDKIMNKSRENMEKMIAMVLIVYAIGPLIGEAIRDQMYHGRKHKLYSGLFILMKQRIRLSKEKPAQIVNQVYAFFSAIVLGDVRTYV